jgi:hypothetical protein
MAVSVIKGNRLKVWVTQQASNLATELEDAARVVRHLRDQAPRRRAAFHRRAGDPHAGAGTEGRMRSRSVGSAPSAKDVSIIC